MRGSAVGPVPAAMSCNARQMVIDQGCNRVGSAWVRPSDGEKAKVMPFALGQHCIFTFSYMKPSALPLHTSHLCFSFFNKTTWPRLHKTGVLQYVAFEACFRVFRLPTWTKIDKFRFTLVWTEAQVACGNRCRLDT